MPYYNYVYISKNAIFDNKKAVRGGIPVVFRKLNLIVFLFGYSIII